MASESDSEFLHHESCPNCGSSDGLARYSDGHAHCFVCQHYEPGDEDTSPKSSTSKKSNKLIPFGEFKALTKRKLTEESCRKWSYGTGSFNGEPVQIANYRDDESGEVVAQKLRFPNKDFKFIGETKKAGLYGMHLWRNGGRRIVITEGEIDAITVSQLQDHKWPVVSLPNGAQGAAKAVKKNLAKLDKFETIVLLFDNDDAGNAAVAEVAPLFPPGKCKVVRLPLKDANEMLLAGRGGEVISALWEAKEYRPDGIVSLKDIRERILTPPQEGYPWFSKHLTSLTYGRRLGEVYGWGAGTGTGKTDLFSEQIEYDLVELGLATAVFSFEQNPAETGKRIAGKYASKRFHVPDGSWTQQELETTLDTLEKSGKLFLYDSFGANDWDVVRGNIRYLAHSENVKVFYIDNLTALVAQEDDEQAALKRIMSEMAGTAKELGIIINYVSHLATPEGKPHEEGGRVMVKHFRGSRVIAYWSNFMFGLERDQQEEDDEIKRQTTLRCVKDRNTGDATGKTVFFRYEPSNGRLVEIDELKVREPKARDFGFRDDGSNNDF